MTARKTTNNKGETVWVCTCGSKLEARYNKKGECAESSSDLVCAWCFK